MGKLIIIEAGDGCGKATQTEKLYTRLKDEGYKVKKVEFPNYKSLSSTLVKMYLNGEFGSDPHAVNCYAASAFYAVDRYASYKQEWEEFYASGGIIIADRYTTSNMVHQAVKIIDAAEKERFLDWLWDFEFVKLGLPIPDCVVFLDVPPEYSKTLISGRVNKSGNEKDIHEQNLDYLADCYNNAVAIAGKYNWCKINCVSNGRLKTVTDIHEEIYKEIKRVADY